jgi:hypothetical protein
MLVEFGARTMEFPKPNFGHLRESNDALGDVTELRRRLSQDGYLFVRSLINRDAILNARNTILEYMAEREVLAPDTAVLEGVMPIGGKSINMLGKPAITHQKNVLRVLEAPELFSFFHDLYDEGSSTYGYKWLRAVGNEQFTGAHCDVVYMGRGSERVNTVWIPLDDIPIAKGTLAICEGSNRLDGFAKLRETYGRMDVDRDHVEGWFTNDPMEILDDFGGRWLTADMNAGDFLTFGLYTMHASTTNTTNNFRLSCDVRFQPESEPMDERWAGQKPQGHYAWMKAPMVTIAQARKQWGV